MEFNSNYFHVYVFQNIELPYKQLNLTRSQFILIIYKKAI